MEKITSGLKSLIENHQFWIFLILFNFILWGGALLLVLVSLFPLNNPQLSVNFNGQTNHPKGFFFGGYLFSKLSNLSALNPNHIPISNIKFIDEKQLANSMENDIAVEELLFERMKLICIRDLKIKRIQKSVIVTVGWVVLSFTTWIAVINI